MFSCEVLVRPKLLHRDLRMRGVESMSSHEAILSDIFDIS